MRRKPPRNYKENRSVTAAAKLSSQTYSWLSQAEWLAHLSISRIIFNMVEFARQKEPEFKKFIEEHEKNY